MTDSSFPPGWDEDRVRKVLEHYESQSQEQAVAEDEAAFEELTESVVKVPTGLLPAIRELIGKYQSQDTSN